jgi:hypothetical protein
MQNEDLTHAEAAEQLADRLVNTLIRGFRERGLPMQPLADELACAAGAIYSSEAGPRAAADMLRRAAAAIEAQLQG